MVWDPREHARAALCIIVACETGIRIRGRADGGGGGGHRPDGFHAPLARSPRRRRLYEPPPSVEYIRRVKTRNPRADPPPPAAGERNSYIYI